MFCLFISAFKSLEHRCHVNLPLFFRSGLREVKSFSGSGISRLKEGSYKSHHSTKYISFIIHLAQILQDTLPQNHFRHFEPNANTVWKPPQVTQLVTQKFETTMWLDLTWSLHSFTPHILRHNLYPFIHISSHYCKGITGKDKSTTLVKFLNYNT